MDISQRQRGASFEQDLLLSVLDQDAVPDILTMAENSWQIGRMQAWGALQDQAAHGRLNAYWVAQPSHGLNLANASFNDVNEDFGLVVEPTDATRTRLCEITRRPHDVGA